MPPIAVAERLRRRVGEETFAVSAQVAEITVTISIGVAVVDGMGDTADAILKRADDALYHGQAFRQKPHGRVGRSRGAGGLRPMTDLSVLA